MGCGHAGSRLLRRRCARGFSFGLTREGGWVGSRSLERGGTVHTQYGEKAFVTWMCVCFHMRDCELYGCELQC